MTADDFQADPELLLRRQAALAEFGRHALITDDLDLLLHEAAVLAAQGLGTEHAKVMEQLPNGKRMLLRAGIGWKPGMVGRATVDAGIRSSTGFTLHTGRPVIAEDLAVEARFEVPALLREHGIRSLVNVIIQGKGRPFGVLEVDSSQPRIFTKDDIDFLQSYANLLAAAIERRQGQEALVQAGRAAARLAEERRLLLRELQHRVKNNLQIITSLLNLQIRRTGDAEMKRQLKVIGSRVETLRVVHDTLYAENSLERIGLAGFVRNLCPTLFTFHGGETQGVTLSVEAAEVDAPVDAAAPLGLLINEFIANSLRHAFPGKPDGTVTVTLERTAPDRARLILTDDGIGLSDPALARPAPTGPGTGLLIMQALGKQLGGTLVWETGVWETGPDAGVRGARVRLDIPVTVGPVTISSASAGSPP